MELFSSPNVTLTLQQKQTALKMQVRNRGMQTVRQLVTEYNSLMRSFWEPQGMTPAEAFAAFTGQQAIDLLTAASETKAFILKLDPNASLYEATHPVSISEAGQIVIGE